MKRVFNSRHRKIHTRALFAYPNSVEIRVAKIAHMGKNCPNCRSWAKFAHICWRDVGTFCPWCMGKICPICWSRTGTYVPNMWNICLNLIFLTRIVHRWLRSHQPFLLSQLAKFRIHQQFLLPQSATPRTTSRSYSPSRPRSETTSRSYSPSRPRSGTTSRSYSPSRPSLGTNSRSYSLPSLLLSIHKEIDHSLNILVCALRPAVG